MKLLLSSLVTAALACIASAAPTVAATNATTDLPARFAMYIVTADPKVNGQRIRYGNGKSRLNPSINLNSPCDSVELTPALF